MFQKHFPSGPYATNDRVGSGFFYDRFYTKFKSPKWRAIVLYGAVITLCYYPSKFIYRFVFEHPYWERRQIRKEQEREIKQLVLMSSNRNRKEALNEMFKEYYIGKYVQKQQQQDIMSHDGASSQVEPNTEEILEKMIVEWYGITNEPDRLASPRPRPTTVIQDQGGDGAASTALSSPSSTISRIINTSELFQLFKR
ncbi:hypothetical protein FDP41_005091 [Naegleria fowleri]|uniref:Uncharacterized protein n=1 Tax=Naegleria fowleri TaxID=5763 RepID=A0A6A5BNU5_NAEFO|nr:uncharacterized protein FDP41_005091 [Naegleria fowleri]KAF0975764.1 hypothetical protein FDP41_005091 [Naegleria fowleri]CAG4708984.1 unnamed protein product [Naegleria fowleri]